jgi:predicted RNase H-like HicB family nuclease
VIRTYSLIVEGDGAAYSAYVPELPTIVVTGSSIEDLTARAKEAVQLYWETLHTDWSPGSRVRKIEVELRESKRAGGQPPYFEVGAARTKRERGAGRAWPQKRRTVSTREHMT